jgi:hypothetical protein
LLIIWKEKAEMARKSQSNKRAKVEVSSLASACDQDILVFCLTQDDMPLCCLALANHALQGYCVSPHHVRHAHAEFLSILSDDGEEVWHADCGFDIQSVMTSLYTLVRFERDDNLLFPGHLMTITPDHSEPNMGIPQLIRSGWMSGQERKDYDMFVVTIPVEQDNVCLNHMFALKAFLETDGTTKTWVVLDVVPGFVPFIVQDIEEYLCCKEKLAAHLIGLFTDVKYLGASVMGVKGDYAHRSFDMQGAAQIGLPYNQEAMPVGALFSFRVYKLNDLKPVVMANPVNLDL